MEYFAFFLATIIQAIKHWNYDNTKRKKIRFKMASQASTAWTLQKIVGWMKDKKIKDTLKNGGKKVIKKH